jgi:hypothetical protein
MCGSQVVRLGYSIQSIAGTRFLFYCYGQAMSKLAPAAAILARRERAWFPGLLMGNSGSSLYRVF